MSDPARLLVDHLDIWTGAVERKSGSRRGNGSKISLYGIDKLRSLILDLAVRGMLVPQDQSDGDAAELLKRAKQAINQAVARKQMRTPKAPKFEPPGTKLPQGWVWARLIDIAQINPRNEADDDSEASFVPMPLVSDRVDGAHETETRRWGDIRSGYTHFAEGDIALAKITPCFENGKAALFAGLENGIGAGTTELHVARPMLPDFDRRYLLLTLKTPRYLAEGEAGMTGTAGQKRVPRGYFELTPFPLPPLAEQKRIGVKVDELMALVDALEAGTRAGMEAHETLVHELLATLVNSQDADDLAQNWSRIETHFDTLFTTEASIDALKQTMVDLAIGGKFSADQAPNWPHRPLGDFVAEVSAGWSPKCIETPRSDDKWGVLKVSAVTWGEFRPDENKELPGNLEPRPEIEVKSGDFLISRANTADLVARSVVVPADAPAKLMMSDKIIRFRFKRDIDADFVNLIHDASYARGFYAAVAGGTSSSMKNVSQSQIKSLQIPVPPLAEQRRIVSIVESFAQLCEHSKAGMRLSTNKAVDLADALTTASAT